DQDTGDWPAEGLADVDDHLGAVANAAQPVIGDDDVGSLISPVQDADRLQYGVPPVLDHQAEALQHRWFIIDDEHQAPAGHGLVQRAAPQGKDVGGLVEADQGYVDAKRRAPSLPRTHRHRTA